MYYNEEDEFEKMSFLKSFMSKDELDKMTMMFQEYMDNKIKNNEEYEPWYTWMKYRVNVVVTMKENL